MSTALSKPGTLNPLVLRIPPNVALELGYDLYLADAEGEGEYTRKQAQQSVEDFNQTAKRFQPGTAEHAYIAQLRMAAVSLGAGIGRLKKTLAAGLKVGDLEMNLFVDSFKKEQQIGGLLTTGLKLVVLCGFSLALAFTVLSMIVPYAPEGSRVSGIDQNHASLMFALGSAMFGYWWRGWWNGGKVSKAFKTFKESIAGPHAQYRDDVRKEYRIAAETAYNAWLQMAPDIEPLVTKAFQRLLCEKPDDPAPPDENGHGPTETEDFAAKMTRLVDHQ